MRRFMRFIKKRNQYENSTKTLTINLAEMTSYSYNWFSMLLEIDGKVFINSYKYSNTTAKHTATLRFMLQKHGIPFQEIDAPNGLTESQLPNICKYLTDEIESLKKKNSSPRARGDAKKYREWDIKRYNKQLYVLSSVLTDQYLEKILQDEMHNALESA